MVVQPTPASALEVVQAQLVLELLMPLFAAPAALDQTRQREERGVRAVIGQVVLPLSVRPALRHQPRFIPRQVLPHGHERPIGDSHPQRHKVRCKLSLSASPPGDAHPCLFAECSNHVLRGLARLGRCGMLPGPSSGCVWRLRQLYIRRINLQLCCTAVHSKNSAFHGY